MPTREARGNSLRRLVSAAGFLLLEPALHFRSGGRRFLTHPLRSSSIYELELAAVIGREASNIAEADAFSYIAGFTIFNDWSCRDLQRDESGSAPRARQREGLGELVGPWIVTTDELAPFIRDGTACTCAAR